MIQRGERRRQVIVHKEFQLKYAGLILVSVFVSVLIAGYTIYYNSWVLLGEKLANVYPQGRLVAIFKMVNLRLAVSLFFVLIICAGIAILASHRIAGPLFRIKRFLEGIAASGDFGQRLRLRKGDQLQDLAASINTLIERLDREKRP
jgi:methyl-accepting chemotaxis protein